MAKHYLTVLSALLSACVVTSTHADNLPVRACATLRDGSFIHGEFTDACINGSTLFAPQLSLQPSIVKTLTFNKADGATKIELANGDRFTFTPTNDTFVIRSILGDLKIPRGILQTLTLSTGRTSTRGAEDGLIFHCTFDDETSITSPAVGPHGVFQGGKFASGKKGTALHVPAHTSCARFTLPKEMVGPAGTIEFWAKADEGPFLDMGCPRFFEILARGGAGEISQDWNANNGNGGSGLTFRIDGLPAMASSKHITSKRRMTSTPSGWHHYVLAWDTKGIDMPGTPSAVVFFDGELLMQTPFRPDWQGPTKLFSESTLFFPVREDEMPGYARRAYTIDEFKIWNFARLPDETASAR